MGSNLQFEFDGVFVFSHWKQNLTIQEVASGLCTGEQQVRDLIEQGQLMAVPINDKLPIGSTGDVRKHMRVARFSVLAFYYERLAAEGQPVPFSQSPQIIWWRNELRKVRNLSPLNADGSEPTIKPRQSR